MRKKGSLTPLRERNPLKTKDDLRRIFRKYTIKSPAPSYEECGYDLHGCGPCLLWTRSRDPSTGYAKQRWRGKNRLAHRLAYWLRYGKIPKGALVLHMCARGSDGCINPKHMYLGDKQDNVDDTVRVDKHVKGEMSGMAKLTNAKVRRARKMWASGNWTQKEIAEVFGVVPSNVSRVLNGKSWKHVK